MSPTNVNAAPNAGSRLPVPSTNSIRLIHDSPPVKTRKALSEVTSAVNQSPTFSSSHKMQPTTDLNKSSTRRKSMIPSVSSGIPAPRMMELPKQRRKVGMPTFTGNSAAGTHLRSLSEANANRRSSLAGPVSTKNHRLSSLGKPVGYISSLQDPDALRRQLDNQERLAKWITLEKDKLHELDKKITDAKKKNEDLEKQKATMQKSISSLKAQISTTEVSLINMDHKLESSKQSVEREKHHNEQMFMLKLKEDQNQMLRELDEFKAMMEQELSNAHSYKDEESQKEIVELQAKLTELSKRIDVLKGANEEKYKAEQDEQEKLLEAVIQKEEEKGDDLSKKYEDLAQELGTEAEKLELLQKEVESLDSELEIIKKDTEKEEELKTTAQSSIDDLTRKIEKLLKANATIDSELEQATQDAKKVDERYQESVMKMHKEKLFRRRIENSIEDLIGKQRVYVRVLPSESPVVQVSVMDEDPSCQILKLNDDEYQFSKVFASGTDTTTLCSECCTLVESILNGCNISFIIAGMEDDDTTTQSMVDHCLSILKEREQRYSGKGWSFSYTAQLVAITSQGVIDLTDNTKADIKLENRTVNCRSKTLYPSEMQVPYTTFNSSTFVKISLTAQSPEKNFTASLFILNLAHIDCFDLIHNPTTKVSQGKFSTTEFEHSMYQLVHTLYSNTKAITILNVEDSDSEENRKWLELAKFVSTVSATPVKRVYSKMN